MNLIHQILLSAKELAKACFIGVSFLILLALYNLPGDVNQEAYTIEHSFFSKTYTVDMKSNVTSDYGQYKDLADLIRSLNKDETIIFTMYNFGGDVQSLNLLINAMDETEGNTVANVIASSYSAGAVLTCHAKQINMAKNSYLMFHNPRYIDGFKVEVVPPGPLRSAVNLALQACVPHGILSQKEIDKMNSTTYDLEIYWYPNAKKDPSIDSKILPGRAG